MKTVAEEKDVGTCLELASFMLSVIEQLKLDRKFAAAHRYLSALHSFQHFSGGRDVLLPVDEVFTPSCLKAYEVWLMNDRQLELNSISDYMRSLRAVYNRLVPPTLPVTTLRCSVTSIPK